MKKAKFITIFVVCNQREFTMSENNFQEKMQEVLADAAEKVSDAVETVSDKLETVADKVEDAAGDAADKVEELADKSLAELSDMFVRLKDSADSMSRSKEAEALKSAFYKLLTKLKGENPDISADDARSNPFEAVEQNFKALYADYKKERAEYNRQQEEQREANLAKKQAIIEDLKALVEGQDDMSSQFPAFREIQNRWREAGPVPAQSFRDINDRYQFYVEKFYDMVKISRDLRDLDFRKNLEAKEALCEAAEKLAENENIVNAFHELQKLHEQWKEYGPVAKEKREEIWDRFKAATAVINKRYQAHFEELKGQQLENLEKKRKLCERVEEIAAREVRSASEWNAFSKEIEDIQAEWRKIGFATKKENQKIYDRFRAACDEFFARRDANASPENDFYGNLKAKKKLIEEIRAYVPGDDETANAEMMREFNDRWQAIGHVPYKEKDAVLGEFREAMQEKFPLFNRQRGGRQGGSSNQHRSPKDNLIAKYNTLQQNIITYENNIGFFSSSSSSNPLIQQMQARIDEAKAELKKLEEQIRNAEEESK